MSHYRLAIYSLKMTDYNYNIRKQLRNKNLLLHLMLFICVHLMLFML